MTDATHLLFTPAEYAQRRRRAATAAAERGFSGLLVADPANLYWLTGYNAWSFYMPQALLIDAADATCLFIGRDMDASVAFRTAPLNDDEVLPYPETLVHRAGVHPFDWVAQQLRERGWLERLAGGPLAIEADAHYFSVRSYLALANGLPGVELLHGDGIVNWLRLVKTDAEVVLMRRAGAIATHAMEVAADHLLEGHGQHELAAAIQHAQAAGIAAADVIGDDPGVAGDGAWYDGDYPALVPLVAAGEAADAPHLTWTAKPLTSGESVSIELAGVHRRYHAPCSRTLALGPVRPEVGRLAEVTVEGLTTAVAAMGPGRTAGEVAATYWDFLAQHGLIKSSRLGYSIGVGYPPDWGEGTVSIRPDDTTVLEPNMTFHVIAGMWMDGYGCEFSESVLVTPQGAETLTHAPRELIRRP